MRNSPICGARIFICENSVKKSPSSISQFPKNGISMGTNG